MASVIEGSSTDIPNPTLKFSTKDGLSGLSAYSVTVDNGDSIQIDASKYTGTFKLPLLAPGKHRITISAVDNADNSVETDITVNIIPIASPVVTFVTPELFSNQQTGVAIKGSAQPQSTILLTLHEASVVVAQATTSSSATGVWNYMFDTQLTNGDYAVSVQAQDSRGARSLVVESSQISVQSEPIFQFGAIKLGAGGAAILMLLILIGGFGGGAWYWKRRNEKLALRVGFAGSEVAKVFRLIEEDVKKISEASKTPTTADDEYAIKRFEENLKKMEAYIKKGIEKIQK